MKKLIYAFGLLALLSLFYLYSCNKSVLEKSESEPATDGTVSEKAGTCGCGISSLWSSCWGTCPVKHGVCTAVCIRIKIGLLGSLGSVCSCTCGGVGSGKLVIPDGVTYDEKNVVFLKAMEEFISDQVGFETLEMKLRKLVAAIETGDPEIVRISQTFFHELNDLPENKAHVLSPEIAKWSAKLRRDKC